MLESLVQDLRYAVRALRRTPSSTAVALLSLMLGIGATTAIFSVIYGVLLSPYPYARPGEIWAPGVEATTGRGGHAYTLDEVRRMTELPGFSDVMATSFRTTLLTGDFPPESFSGVLLTGNAFNFLGVPPVLGRTIQPSDVQDSTVSPVVVISHRLWLRLFEGSADVLGKTLRLNGVDHAIIGVMPPRFGWYGSEGFWLPMTYREPNLQYIAPIVRLAPGVSADAARAALEAFNTRLAEETPSAFPARGFRTLLTNYLDITVASGEMRTSLRVLLGAVAFLLLIACANVAVLQLARGSARAREMSVRLSIGADRGRLVRQLLTESVVLSIAGGAAGVAFAAGATRLIVSLMPPNMVPNEARVELNVWVLLFSLAVSLVTGVVAGLVPALQTSKADLTDALRASRSTGSGAQGSRMRHALVVAEVALAVVLLVGAGLMSRTFLALSDTDPGFSASRVLIVNVPLSAERYATRAQRLRFNEDLLARVSALPGVESATYGAPFGGGGTTYAIPGVPQDAERRMFVNTAGTDYLRTFGIALREGRMLDAGEVARGDRVALVNETAAKLWPAGQSPVGTRLRLGFFDPPASPNAPSATADLSLGQDVTIVGIMADTRNSGFREATVPIVLVPYTTFAPLNRNLAVRTTGDPSAALNPIRAAVRDLDPQQPLGRPITIAEVLGQEVEQPRFTMAVFLTFAGLGLVLAAAGIYSVLSFHVARRKHELGVRMALGAQRSHVVRLMLSMGGRLVAGGLVAGVALSLVVTRLLRSQLYGVGTADPVAYLAVVVVLGAVAFAACWLPARRASHVDPMVALRED